MRLSLVIPSFYPAVVYGGPIFATLHAAEALSRDGISIYVSTTNANGKEKLEVKTCIFIKCQENINVKYYNETIVKIGKSIGYKKLFSSIPGNFSSSDFILKRNLVQDVQNSAFSNILDGALNIFANRYIKQHIKD